MSDARGYTPIVTVRDEVDGATLAEIQRDKDLACKLGFHLTKLYPGHLSTAEQNRSKGRRKKGPLGGCELVPVVHGRAPRATRRALDRLTRRRARVGPVGPRGQAWAGWSVQLAVGV